MENTATVQCIQGCIHVPECSVSHLAGIVLLYEVNLSWILRIISHLPLNPFSYLETMDSFNSEHF